MFAKRRVRRKGQGRSAVEKRTANTRKYGPGVMACGNGIGPHGRYEHTYGIGMSRLSALRTAHRPNGYKESAIENPGPVG